MRFVFYYTSESSRHQDTQWDYQQLEFGSVAKVWDVIIGVTAVTLRSIVGDSQMVKSRKKNKYSDDDDGNGAVGMLKKQNKKGESEGISIQEVQLFIS